VCEWRIEPFGMTLDEKMNYERGRFFAVVGASATV